MVLSAIVVIGCEALEGCNDPVEAGLNPLVVVDQSELPVRLENASTTSPGGPVNYIEDIPSTHSMEPTIARYADRPITTTTPSRHSILDVPVRDSPYQAPISAADPQRRHAPNGAYSTPSPGTRTAYRATGDRTIR